MSTAQADDRFAAIQRQSDEYEGTVHALLSFSAYVVHTGEEARDGAHFGFGRRMETSAANRIAPNARVTPDLVAQKDKTYGIVAEVKRSLSSDRNRWDTVVRQLRKYDDDLTGWWTPTEAIEQSNAVLLLHQTRSRAFLSYLRSCAENNEEAVGPRTALVEFNLSSEVNPYIFFRSEWGALSDPELNERLTEGVAVPLNDVLRTFPSVKFYDAPPPIPWLMMLLWTDLFAATADPSAYDEKLKAIPLEVSVDAITGELQKAYGSAALERDERSAEFPRAKWVRQALDCFVAGRLASRGNPSGTYKIHYRPLRGDILKRFVMMTAKSQSRESFEDELQTALPFEGPSGGAGHTIDAGDSDHAQT